MLEPLSADRPPVLGPFLLGAGGAGVVLVIVLYNLPRRPDEANPSTVASLLALPLAAAFFWSGFVRLMFTKASLGVPAAGYAAVWALLGLALLLLTMDMQYIYFLFVSFICLFLGRIGERAAKWVFPERFRSQDR